MNISERFLTYFSTIEKELHPELLVLLEQGIEDNIPMIGKGVQNFLMVLMELVRPRRILELGTAYGFSAALMAKYDPKLMELVTIESYDKRIAKAKENFKRLNLEDKITLLEGDATKLVSTLDGEFDFIFMDASKGQYDTVWPVVRTLVKPGGIIITDDIMQDDTILESKFAITRRNRTIHKRMRSFLKAQLKDEMFTGAVFSIDDGISFLVRNREDIS